MEIFKIPHLFKDDPSFLKVSNTDIGIKFYDHEQEVIRANVVLETNALIFVIEGTKTIYHHSKTFQLSQFEGAFLKKGSYLMSEKSRERGCYKAILFFFSDEEASKHLNLSSNLPKTNQGTSSPTKIESSVLLARFLQSLKNYPNLIHPQKDTQLIQLKFSELLALVQKSHPYFDSLLDIHPNKAKIDLVHLMEANFTEHISLEQYAFLTNLSLSTFKRKFQQYFNQLRKVGLRKNAWN